MDIALVISSIVLPMIETIIHLIGPEHPSAPALVQVHTALQQVANELPKPT